MDSLDACVQCIIYFTEFFSTAQIREKNVYRSSGISSRKAIQPSMNGAPVMPHFILITFGRIWRHPMKKMKTIKKWTRFAQIPWLSSRSFSIFWMKREMPDILRCGRCWIFHSNIFSTVKFVSVEKYCFFFKLKFMIALKISTYIGMSTLL